MLFAEDGTRLAPVPRRVAILGMGATLIDFVNLQLMAPGKVVDEVWALNNTMTAVQCDVGIAMDDFVEMMETPYMGRKHPTKPGEWAVPPAQFWDESNVDLMRYAREKATFPILTSRAYRPRYPTSCNYPLDYVLREVLGDRAGFAFNNTTAYAIALAWALGVRELHIYGCDFAYPWHDPYDRRKTLEEGKACVESLLLAGTLMGKFTFNLSAKSSLFDTLRKRPFYGYADGRRAVSDDMINDLGKKEIIHNDTRQIPGERAPGAEAATAAVGAANAIDPAAPASAGAAAAGGRTLASAAQGAGSRDANEYAGPSPRAL